jgi:hypothetical protein
VPDLDFTARANALLAAYGRPRLLSGSATAAALGLISRSDVPPEDVIAFRYSCREEAEAWHGLNAEHFGHPSLGIAALTDPADGVVGVLDLRRRPVAEMTSD